MVEMKNFFFQKCWYICWLKIAKIIIQYNLHAQDYDLNMAQRGTKKPGKIQITLAFYTIANSCLTYFG